MIEVLKSGIYSSLQDLGRFGHRSSGVPLSGAMDLQSASWANHLVGNREMASVLEFTASGPVLKFMDEAYIAITGADFKPKVNGQQVHSNSLLKVEKGAVLSFTAPSIGLRGYLAIAGGFITEKVLGSTSFYNSITRQAQLTKGDLLRYDVQKKAPSGRIRTHFKPIGNGSNLFVDKGPEFNKLSSFFQDNLFITRFVVSSKSSRMAYVLEHKKRFYVEEIVTSAVQPGTVQLTPGGNVIVLMRDAQTTGGYGRILQLTEDSINLLAQKRAGEIITFKLNET